MPLLRRPALAGWFILPALIIACSASAEWLPGGNPVNLANQTAEDPHAAADGAGGVFVVHDDLGSPRLTHFDANGERPRGWPAADVDVQAGLGPGTWRARHSRIVSDGVGGAYVVSLWRSCVNCEPFEEGHLYAQHINDRGELAPGWTSQGVSCGTEARGYAEYYDVSPTDLMATSDGEGGLIVVWRFGHQDGGVWRMDMRAQRITPEGRRLWGDTSLLIASSALNEGGSVVGDDRGGASVFWTVRDPHRGDVVDVVQQSVSGAGELGWPVPRQVSPPLSGGVMAMPDGAHGARVVWSGLRDTVSVIESVRITPGDGVPRQREMTVASHLQGLNPGGRAAAPVPGGVVVAWGSLLNDAVTGVRAQRLDRAGRHLWPDPGAPVWERRGGDAWTIRVASDDAGGAYFAWGEDRAEASGAGVYAMRLDGTGSPSIGWASDGVPISNSGSHTYGSVRALDIMPDGAGNAFVVWCDATETPARVFVQKLVPSGPAAPVSGVGTLAWLRRTGTPSGSTTSGLFWLRTGVRDRSSPLAIEFSLSEPSMAHLELLDVSGRRLIDRDVSGLGLGTHRVDLAQGRPLPPGLYFVRLRQGDHSASLKRVVIP